MTVRASTGGGAIVSGVSSVTAGNPLVIVSPTTGAVVVYGVPQTIPATTGNGLISGGQVFWLTGLQFAVNAATYIIQGVQYSSLSQTTTLAAADGTLNRIDAIYVDSTGTVGNITGTPATNPAVPSVDPATQLALSFVYIPAGATQPPGVTNTIIYAENVEWTMTTSGATINTASTSNPHGGTKDIEATAAVATNWFQAANSADIVLTNYNLLAFYIASKATWPNPKQLSFQWRDSSGNNVGTPVVLNGNNFGFLDSNTAYQLVVIPTANFNTANQNVRQLRATVNGGGAAIGFYVDDIYLQAGVTTLNNQQYLTWRGVYSASVSYQLNDVVYYHGQSYVMVALTSTGNTPDIAASSAMWAPVGPNGPRTVTYAATTTVDLSSYPWSDLTLDLTLTGNVTFNFTNGYDGQVIRLRVRQDGTGSRIWTSGANIRVSADITSIVLSTAASKLDYLGFMWNGTDGKADILAINKGF